MLGYQRELHCYIADYDGQSGEPNQSWKRGSGKRSKPVWFDDLLSRGGGGGKIYRVQQHAAKS